MVKLFPLGSLVCNTVTTAERHDVDTHSCEEVTLRAKKKYRTQVKMLEKWQEYPPSVCNRQYKQMNKIPK